MRGKWSRKCYVNERENNYQYKAKDSDAQMAKNAKNVKNVQNNAVKNKKVESVMHLILSYQNVIDLPGIGDTYGSRLKRDGYKLVR